MDEVERKYHEITCRMIRSGLTFSAMESCTSGTIASLITDTDGSSAVMKGAFVTYSNEAKVRCGVPAEVIRQYGVYSSRTAEEMAVACRAAYGAEIAVGVTGTLGSVDPANADSVPGTVWFAVASGKEITAYRLEGIRAECRREAKLFVAEKIADVLLQLPELCEDDLQESAGKGD